MPPADFKELVEGWLARASNPTPGMDADLRSAREKILQLEHRIQEDKKILELKQQEDNIKTERLEKVIMIMAVEINNLHKGITSNISSVKDKDLKEAQEKIKAVEKEKDELVADFRITPVKSGFITVRLILRLT